MAPTPRRREPQQQRSRSTLERLLAATERLLRRRRFEEISVADIVRAARSSVGVFYARFERKEALLPHLYERYDRGLQRRLSDMVRRRAGRDASPAAYARQLIGQVFQRYRRHRWLFRALTLYARQHGDAIGAAIRRPRTDLHRWMGRMVAERLGLPLDSSSTRRVELAIFIVAAACRDRILYPDAPHAASLAMSDRAFQREATRMFLAYLRADLAEPGESSSDRPVPRRAGHRGTAPPFTEGT